MLVSDIQRFSLNKFKNIADSLYKISEKLLNDIIYWQYSDDKFENKAQIEHIIVSMEQLRLHFIVAHTFNLLSQGFLQEMTQALIGKALRFGYLLKSEV